MRKDKQINFPEGFLWGVATSSHQVEGNNHNDWTNWEVRGGSKNISGAACNHWDPYQFTKDLGLAKSIGVNAYRLSVEWSRIMPRPGIIDYEALDHYRQMLRQIREMRMKTVVTLHHYTNPLWFVEQGGWENSSLDPFINYVNKVSLLLGDDVDFWSTFNEPSLFILSGWIRGVSPPGKKGKIWTAYKLARKLVQAHNAAYDAIKRHSSAPVGIVYNFTCYEPARDYLLDRLAVWYKDYLSNQWFLRRTKNDFLGVNYYFYDRLRVHLMPPRVERLSPENPVSDLGWEIYPEGLYKVLHSIARYHLPVMVTENGVADAADRLRSRFILDHVAAVHRAIKEGVDVRGYFHWTLLDLFEWEHGFWPRFGLLEVDHKTQERKIRPSAIFYRDICVANGITEAILSKHKDLINL